MPLSWAIANYAGVDHPELFLTLCFAAVMDGSVFGDQCSPISDTTVLSAMCTGCDLMDHVLIRSELEEIYNVFQHTKLHESSCVNSPKKLERNKRNSFTSLNELADNYYKTKR